MLVSPEGDTYTRASDAARALGCNPLVSRFFRRPGTVARTAFSPAAGPRVLGAIDTAPALPAAGCGGGISPYGLLEELFVLDPWKCLVACILLNQTTREQVDPILSVFLETYPDPQAAVEAELLSLQDIMRPLGLHRRRAVTLKAFSAAYDELESEKGWNPGCWINRSSAGRRSQPEALPTEDAASVLSAAVVATKCKRVARLPGVGEYAVDAFRLLCCRSPREKGPKDHALAWVHNYRAAATPPHLKLMCSNAS